MDDSLSNLNLILKSSCVTEKRIDLYNENQEFPILKTISIK